MYHILILLFLSLTKKSFNIICFCMEKNGESGQNWDLDGSAYFCCTTRPLIVFICVAEPHHFHAAQTPTPAASAFFRFYIVKLIVEYLNGLRLHQNDADPYSSGIGSATYCIYQLISVWKNLTSRQSYSENRTVLYRALLCVNQWEEGKYFSLFRYWLKSKGT
jgi:hypothetical protein